DACIVISRLQMMGKCVPHQLEQWLDRELLTPCFEVDVVGTTGAGDCMIAGFLTGILKGHTPEEVMLGAVAVGAFNVEVADATSGVPTWENVQCRINNGWDRSKPRMSLTNWEWDEAAGMLKVKSSI